MFKKIIGFVAVFIVAIVSFNFFLSGFSASKSAKEPVKRAIKGSTANYNCDVCGKELSTSEMFHSNDSLELCKVCRWSLQAILKLKEEGVK